MEKFKAPKDMTVVEENEDLQKDEDLKTRSTLTTKKTLKNKESTLRSDIWNDFTRFQDENDTWKARCKHCSAVFSSDTNKNGTSSLWKHSDKTCRKKPRTNSTQKELTMTKVGAGGEALTSWMYDPQVSRKKLAEMIILDELPFAHVDGAGFQSFVASLNPKFHIPSRFTIQRDCYKIYREEKDKLFKFLKKSKQRVCLTTDTWTSVQQINYMCITMHYIDDNWNLCKNLLSFSTIESHRGKDLAIAIEKILHAWGIDKIFTITVDNASSNDVSIKHLKDEYGSKKENILGGEFMHMRCVAHILNLACLDGLKLRDAPKSVVRIREAVRYVKHSPARLSRFKECMLMEGDQSKVELALDIKTRWNSTYFMLNAALKHEKVWKRFEKEDRFFSLELLEDGGVGVPEASDWDYIRRLHSFLKHFYELTLKISGSKYITSNLFYHEIIALTTTLKQWMRSNDVDMSKTATKMKEKFDKYWGSPEKMNKLIFIAAIMDPRYNLKFLEFTMHFLHDDPKMADLMKVKIKESLYKIFNHYKEELAPVITDERNEGSLNVESSSRKEKSGSSSAVMMEIYQMFDGESEQVVKSDLDVYLEEGRVNKMPNFDILQWWKGNAIRFPILSQMARDVLAMPISTVASESAFSTGGRVLDDFRSSLAPSNVEALLCCQDWLRGSFLPINMEENPDDQEKIASENAHASLDAPSEIVDVDGDE